MSKTLARQTRVQDKTGALNSVRTDRVRATFLELLREYPSIQSASRKMGMSKSSFYKWMREDKDFAKEVAEAYEQGREDVADQVESTLADRLIHGWEEPVIFQGRMVKVTVVHEDGSTERVPLGIPKFDHPGMFRLLEAYRPEKWGKSQQIALTGKDGEKLFEAKTLEELQAEAKKLGLPTLVFDDDEE